MAPPVTRWRHIVAIERNVQIKDPNRMKMGKPSYLLILITSWFLLELTLSEEEISLLPTNMKVHLYPGLVKITWDCNITESMKKYTYDILLNDSFDERLNVSACIFEYFIPKDMAFSIHTGFNAEIHASHIDETKKLTAMPEGKENSAAENFSCEVYVSIVNCSWTAGREAPKDTQYSLVFRGRDNNSIPCKDYRNDYFGRQVGCVLKSPNMSFNITYYIELVGSSNETSIRFYDGLLILKEYVILDPPRNIRLNYSLNNLKITWEKPETYSELGEDCFEYNININGKKEESFKATDKEPHSYTKAIVLENKNLMVSMRAKFTCPDKEKWSRWSEPLIYVPSSGSMSLAAHHRLTILGIVTAAVLFILIFLCHRYRIWKKLFPKVPQPAMKFFDRAEQKQFWDQNIVGESPPKKDDDEECICSPITEISQKDQLQIMS